MRVCAYMFVVSLMIVWVISHGSYLGPLTHCIVIALSGVAWSPAVIGSDWALLPWTPENCLLTVNGPVALHSR